MTKSTKEIYRFFKRVALFTGVLFITTLGFRGGGFQNSLKLANAATIKVHNYVTNDTYDYTGVQVSYCINGTAVPLTTPGLILSNGAAIGPCKEIFLDGLGVSSDYSEGKDTFSLSYGSCTIQMTLGNSAAYVNGSLRIMPNAPIVYSFQNSQEKHLYVPTRFVAEAFGFTYEWNSSTATSSIYKLNTIYDGTEMLKYSGLMPKLYFNNKQLETAVYPCYFFEDCALVSATQVFEKNGLAAYSYNEGSGLIVLRKGEVQVRLVLDSPVAYINDTPQLLETVPRLITPAGVTEAEVYIPALFVADALGYTVAYDKNEGALYISGVRPAEKLPEEQNPPDGAATLDTASYGSVLFSFEAHEQVVEHYTMLGYQVPSMVSAYSCVNSDALYLKGIRYDTVKITDKQDVIEIEVSDCHNPFGGEYTYEPENSFLNYCFIFGTDRLRITIIKTKDLQYYSYEAPDGMVIHFTDTAGMYEDSLHFIRVPEISENTGLAGSDTTEEVPAAVFTREYFVIPLPEGVTASDISDFDDYGNKCFMININGNHMKFLTEQDVYNPVSTLKSYQINYKVADNTTVITFSTTKIQGYSYLVCDGMLAVKIANPQEIYDKIVVLDAGHGGIDPGTLRGSVYEKTVNYNVVNVYAPEYFKNSDIKVYYTRTTDTKIALDDRAAFAKAVGADFFISFHVNAHSNSTVSGTSVYYSASNNTANESGLKSSILATTVLNHLCQQWGTKNRGILTAKFVVIHNNTVPAVLVECGFITNNSDFAKIKDTAYQKKAAKALFDSVTEIFKQYPTNR